MYIISPFTPLFFRPSTDKFGAGSKYTQTWAPSDRILVEVIAFSDDYGMAGIEGNVPTLYVNNLETGERVTQNWHTWAMNTDVTVYWSVISGLLPGIYSVTLWQESEPFCVSEEAVILEQTTLIQYSMADNRRRLDGVFLLNGMRNFFDFRVPGGFKDDNWVFGVDNEQFTTHLYDVLDIYSHEQVVKTFTMGGSIGCPVWFGELLNRVLTCSYVYFDGVRYSRHESEVPELTQELEDLRSYIITQKVQKVTNLDPNVEKVNALRLRRVGLRLDNDDFRETTTNHKLLNL